MHTRRIESEMRSAARSGGCYHIWCHPHNFGRNMAENLNQLDAVISFYRKCQNDFGMVSKSMNELPHSYIDIS